MLGQTRGWAGWIVPLAVAGMLSAVAIWGVNFVVVKDAVSRWPVFPFLAARFTIATVSLIPLVLQERRQSASYDGVNISRVVSHGGWAGAALFGAYATQTFGIRYAPASTAAFLTSLYLVFVPLFLMLTPGNRIRRATVHEWGGALTAVCGVLVINEVVAPALALRHMLLIGAAGFFALQVLVVGARGHRGAPVLFTAIQMTVVALVSTCFAIPDLLSEGAPLLQPRIMLALLFTGLIASTLAYLLQTWAQGFVSSTQAAVILALEPVFATGTAWLVLGETLSPRFVLGSALILVAVALSQVTSLRRDSPVHPAEEV